MRLPDSDDQIVILHNPRCSKSRQGLELLVRASVPHQQWRYLEQPPTLDELREIGRRLGRPPIEWLRRKEDAFKASGLGPEADADALYALMARHPKVMERPIVIRGKRAVLGRPPEAIETLLD
ncbi:MAG: arsenate reductase family protein [Acidobacteriota bacterium]|nr:arsenate reductase family protein [Acidobacteriota bacterium]MDQ7087043.1 arsenate reductase family protein [Acidobacteriota bacterium]